MLTEDTEGTEDFLERGEQLVEEIGSQREVELFYPLLSVAPNKQIEQELIQYAKTSASRKMEELSLTTEATCLSAILQAKERGSIQNGRIYIRDITKIINEGLTIEEHWKERFTSSLCARLGFQKSRGAHGRAVILWNDKLIERLKKDKRYTSCFTPDLSETPSESSEPSVEKWENIMKHS